MSGSSSPNCVLIRYNLFDTVILKAFDYMLIIKSIYRNMN
jgi:hypothetical protein